MWKPLVQKPELSRVRDTRVKLCEVAFFGDPHLKYLII